MNELLEKFKIRSKEHELISNRCDEALTLFSTAYKDPYFYGKRHKIMEGIDELLDLRNISEDLQPTVFMHRFTTIGTKYRPYTDKEYVRQSKVKNQDNDETAF